MDYQKWATPKKLINFLYYVLVVIVVVVVFVEYICGMGRTWQIFARICLPCGRNLSSVDIAKCDPEFSS